MHVHHLIAVEAASSDEAKDAVDGFLESYEGQVWDYYTVGGRWAGLFGDDEALCADTDPALFDRCVQKALESRAAEIESLRASLRGSSASYHDPFGFTEANTAALERQNAHHCRDAEQFARMLADPDPERDEYGLLGYRLYKLGQLLVGNYCYDSFFYDAVAYSASRRYLDERLGKGPASQWIVSVDLHN